MIPVKNIYYMLAYAFSGLKSQGYNDLATEEFDNAADLLAAILARGINMQVKRGLSHTYVAHEEVTSSPHGKIDVNTSVKAATLSSRQLACSYDEFTADAYLNRILKTAGQLLLEMPIRPLRKRALRRSLAYLHDVTVLDPRKIEWRQRYDRATSTYRMLVNICHLAIAGSLQSKQHGNLRLEDFIDDQQMSKLYEHFILEYFRQEHAADVSANAPYIPWALDDDNEDMLPKMHTDVTLRGKGAQKDVTLIIDAKYYSSNTQVHFDSQTVHSGNLYQIFSYVKNEDERLRRLGKVHAVAGMLLYANTDEFLQPDATYHISGNEITVNTLDLNCDFPKVAAQLDAILKSHF